MRTFLTYGCRLALCAGLGLLSSTVACAQLLCERVLAVPATAQFMRTTGLLQPQPDSLRLLNNYGPNTGSPTYHRITRVAVGTCDTLTLPGAAFPTPDVQSSIDFRVACTTRRGGMLVSSVQRGGRAIPGLDSALLRLTLLDRNGRVRWSRLVAGGCHTGARGLLEAPDGGFYVSGGGLMRVDSAGRMLWCRRYGSNTGDLRSPTYSRRGTLLFSVLYGPGAGVLEVGQQGDSLGFTPVMPPGSTSSNNGTPFSPSTEVLRPLRDGGLLMLGEADSASATNRDRHFLARLDRNLGVSWVFALPSRLTNPLRMVQPFELADGTILVLVTSDYSGRGQPFWLYHLSAAGALLQRYPFTSQVLPPRINAFSQGYLGWVQGVQPLRDSSFVLASTYRDPTRNHTYLAHLRVPGLPRVLNSSFFPLAARPGAALAPEALGPPHPNPAAETVAFTYVLPGGSAPAVLVLRDVAGRRVLAQALAGRAGTAHLALAGLPGGLYLATLEVGGQPYGGARKLAVLP